MDANGTGPVCLQNLRAGLCPAEDVQYPKLIPIQKKRSLYIKKETIIIVSLDFPKL